MNQARNHYVYADRAARVRGRTLHPFYAAEHRVWQASLIARRYNA